MMRILGLDHIVLRVRDMERMIGFWRDALGCPVEKIQAELGLVHIRAGTALVDLFGGGEAARARLETSTRRMLALAAAEGLPMTARTHTYNSKLDKDLGTWATELGMGPDYHDVVFRAYFARAEDISDPR